MTQRKTSRRAFLSKTAGVSAMAGLMSGLPSGWVGSVYADDSPETTAMRFGMIALTDCAPIVIAHELGYFKKFGIDSVVSKEASWASSATNESGRTRARTCARHAAGITGAGGIADEAEVFPGC